MQKILELLNKAVTEEFVRDSSAPGVLISWLPSGEWYVAIHRYTHKLGNGRQVVCSSRGEDLEKVILKVAAAFNAYLGKGNAREKLDTELLNIVPLASTTEPF